MFASTGPKEDPILTPSFCSYNLLLKVNTVFVQVSNIRFFKVLLLRFVEINLSPYIRFKYRRKIRANSIKNGRY